MALSTRDNEAALAEYDFISRLRQIQSTNIPAIDNFLAFLQNPRQVSGLRDVDLYGLSRISWKDSEAKRIGELLPALEATAIRVGIAASLEGPSWLNRTGNLTLDNIHLARQAVRRWERRKFAPDGWVPEPEVPTPKRLRFSTPRASYIAYGLFLVEAILRVRASYPYASVPEPEEYD